MTWSQCLGSLFRLHNETGNIWTHLVGCAIFVIFLLSGPHMARVMYAQVLPESISPHYVKDNMKSWADDLVERFHSIKAYAQELNFSEPLQSITVSLSERASAQASLLRDSAFDLHEATRRKTAEFYASSVATSIELLQKWNAAQQSFGSQLESLLQMPSNYSNSIAQFAGPSPRVLQPSYPTPMRLLAVSKRPSFGGSSRLALLPIHGNESDSRCSQLVALCRVRLCPVSHAVVRGGHAQHLPQHVVLAV